MERQIDEIRQRVMETRAAYEIAKAGEDHRAFDAALRAYGEALEEFSHLVLGKRPARETGEAEDQRAEA